MHTVKGTLVAAISILMAIVLTGFGYFIYDEVRMADLARMDARLQSHAEKLREEIEEQIDEHRFPDIPPLRLTRTEGLTGALFALYDTSGTVLYADSALIASKKSSSSTQQMSYRSLLEPPETIDSLSYTLQVAAPLAEVEADLSSLRSLLMIAVPVIVLLSALLIYYIVRRAFEPISRMIQSAEGISAGNLHERLTLPDAHSEVFALGTALNRMMERIESAFRVQKQFVADASHEIRTPLSIIQSELDFVRRLTSDRASKESLETAMAETDHLKQLTADILLLAQLDTVSVRLTMGSVRLDEMLTDCVKRLTAVAAGNSIVIDLHIDEPVEIRADGSRIESVIINLLDNAIKYSGTGGTVGVTLRKRGSRAEVIVTDSGPGIPAEDIPSIFKRFHRGSLARTMSAGSGLGLAIAQRIVELHRGTIAVESEAGKGSTFTVSLPLSL